MKKKLQENKGQAAMEFLLTYGWVLLFLLAAIGALAYFGVLNPSRFLPPKENMTYCEQKNMTTPLQTSNYCIKNNCTTYENNYTECEEIRVPIPTIQQ